MIHPPPINYLDRASQEKQVLVDAIRQRWPHPEEPPPAEVMLLMETAAAVHTWGATISSLLVELTERLPERADPFHGATLVCRSCNYREVVTNEREVLTYQRENSWPQCHGEPMLLQLLSQQPPAHSELGVAS